MHGTINAERDHRAGTSEREIFSDGLSDFVCVRCSVANIVGNLIGFAELFADDAPRLCFRADRCGPCYCGSGKQRARL